MLAKGGEFALLSERVMKHPRNSLGGAEETARESASFSLKEVMEHRVALVYDDAGGKVAGLEVQFDLPADVTTSAGLDLRIEGGRELVLRGVSGSNSEHRVKLAHLVNEETVRAKYQKKRHTLIASLDVICDHCEAGAAPSDASAPAGRVEANDAPAPEAFLSNGPPELLRVAHDAEGVFGRHVRLTRPIDAAGELLLLEEAVALLKPGAAVAGCPEQSDEWLLTHALLEQGKRSAWASEYVMDKRDDSLEKSSALPWLSAQFACEESDVLAVFRAVANNAFSLDSAVMRIKYGAAFFSEAALFNHSCSPNCHSRRMGGNMAMFSSRPIAAGEELTHSYIPHDLLLSPEPMRAAHLHFRCECARCTHERGDARIAAQFSRLQFPPSHPLTPAGMAVGAFKLACVMANAKIAHAQECEAILAAGDECLVANHALLLSHPAAALEIATPYLNALWGALTVGSDLTTRAFSPSSAENWEGGGGVGQATACKVLSGRRHGAWIAALLLQQSPAAIRREMEQVGVAGGGNLFPAFSSLMLEAEAAVMAYVLGAQLRRKSLPAAVRALTWLLEGIKLLDRAHLHV